MAVPFPAVTATPLVVGRDAVVATVVEAARRGRGAVVSGIRGAGRSTVVAAAAERLRSDGATVLRVAPAAGGGAFAALRPLVPVPSEEVGASSLAAVGEALVASSGVECPVVVVEDLDDLDDPSAAVLHQLLASARITLLGSVRSDRTPGDGGGWWRDVVERVTLGPLDRAASDALVEAVVGGPVDAQTRERLWAFGRGHPGWLVAAVRATVDASRWERVSGLWALAGSLDDSVDAEVLARVDATPPDARAVLQALALAGPVPIDDAEALGGPAALAEAERQGLVAVDTDDDGVLWCRPASDLVATVLRTSLDPVTARDRWGRLAEVLGASAAPVGAVPIARARALVESGRVELGEDVAPADRDALVAGAEAALVRSRWSVAATLAERAWRLGAGPDCLRVLTQALGQVLDREAIAALAADLEGSTDVDEVVQHAESLAVSQFHVGDAEGAWATLARARTLATDDAGRRLADMAESRLRSFHGQQEEARALTARWRHDPDPLVRIEVIQMAGTAAVHRGAYQEGIDRFDEAFALATSGSERASLLAGVPFLFRLSACADMGRLAEALAGAEAVEPQSATLGDPTGHGWLTLHLARVHLAAGRSRTAARWFRESIAALRKVNRPGWLAHPSAGLVAALALAGEQEEAAEAREGWRAIGPHAVALFRSEELRFVAALAAAEGDAPTAVDLLAEARVRAERNGSHPYVASALHDLARLGGPAERDDAAAALARVAAVSDSPLVEAHATQAAALADGSVAGLVEAGRAYADMGALVDAAECWAEVARRSDDAREAADARRRVAELRARGEDMVTPLLGAPSGGAALTEREEEIVELLVAGATRQEVADRLVVSVRTVDSHLQRVYRKLGVRGREELVTARGESR